MWLRLAGFKAETESLLIAGQNQALRTKYRNKHILELNVSPLCRICKQNNETLTHILSSYPILAPKQYIYRHDKVAKMLHFNVCKAYNVAVVKDCYDHVPNQSTNNEREGVRIYWNSSTRTDRTISANKQDTVIRDNNKRKYLLIDVAIPADNNIAKKEAEKILKYSDMRIEIQKMWNMKTDIIPIIVGSTGAISKN